MRRKGNIPDMEKKLLDSSVSFWLRLRRTPYQSIASIFMIFITLFVMGVYLVLAGGLTAILSYFESKPQITIFFKDVKDKDSVTQLIDKLKSTGKVASYDYITKDQALGIYREQNKNDPLLLEMVTADILPASLEISATSPQNLFDIADIVKKEQGIDEVVFQKDIVDTLITWTTTLRKAGLIFILFLTVSTFFIIITTVGMKIAFKKDEIEILKLVGATSWFIKKPFILEGLIYGIIGATAAWGIVVSFILYFHPFISSFLRGIPELILGQIQGQSIYIWPPSISAYLLLYTMLLLSGMIIGFIGSFYAVSRYMKN